MPFFGTTRFPAPGLGLITGAMNVLAGMTGSASGGISIALSTLGDTYLAMTVALGLAAGPLLELVGSPGTRH